MRRFRFRLEGIFRLRREQEREAMLEVQRMRHELETTQHRIKTLGDERSAWVKVYNGATLETGGERNRWLIEQYLVGLDRETLHQHAMEKRWMQQLERAMNAARLAMRARKQVEYLRDRQWEAHQQELKWQEIKMLDELSVLRHAHTQEVRAWAV